MSPGFSKSRIPKSDLKIFLRSWKKMAFLTPVNSLISFFLERTHSRHPLRVYSSSFENPSETQQLRSIELKADFSPSEQS